MECLVMESVNEPIAFTLQLVKYFQCLFNFASSNRADFYDLLSTETIFSVKAWTMIILFFSEYYFHVLLCCLKFSNLQGFYGGFNRI